MHAAEGRRRCGSRWATPASPARSELFSAERMVQETLRVYKRVAMKRHTKMQPSDIRTPSS